MLYAGIDVGSLTAEAVVVKNGQVVAHQRMNVLPNPVDSAREIVTRLEAESRIRWADVAFAVSTGYGREQVEKQGLAHKNVSEISCHGYGAAALSPHVRTVIDVGGQDAKVIRLGDAGELLDFAMNDKCAAGTGQFLEVMSQALGVSLDELGPLSMDARQPVRMSSRCSIYVETEVHHYLQRGVAKAEIAAGVNRAMAERVAALVRRVGLREQAMMTGGVAKNNAVRAQLEKILGARMQSPRIDPQLVGAYGAAMLACLEGGGE